MSTPTAYTVLNDELLELYPAGRLRMSDKNRNHFPRRLFRLINTEKEPEDAAVWVAHIGSKHIPTRGPAAP